MNNFEHFDAPLGRPVGPNALKEKQLSSKQEKALLVLLEGVTVPQTAEKVDVCAQTIYRWLRNEDFQAELKRRRRAVFFHGLGRVQHSVHQAIDTLEQIMADQEAPPSAHSIAARAVITFGCDSIIVDDLEARVNELEAAAKTIEAPPKPTGKPRAPSRARKQAVAGAGSRPGC